MESISGYHTYREILSQGEAWAATLDSVEGQAGPLLDWLRQPRAEVLFTGCGSTYYLSLAAAAHWQAITGARARGVPGSDLWLYPDSTLPSSPSLLVTVSRSAETTETLRALDTYNRYRAGDSLAISVYGDRLLNTRTTRKLVTRGAEEESVAQTRSFSSMFILAQAAAGLAADRRQYLQQLSVVPQAFDRLVHSYGPMARELGEDHDLERFVFLGSGAYYGLACEAMLKMKEMSLTPSEAFHFLEFRHGPKSVVAPGTVVVGLVNEIAYQQELQVLADMKDLGATTVALVESSQGGEANYVVQLDSGVEPLARGALLLPIMQLTAYYRSLSKDLNPDRPTNLEAVVRL